MGYEKSNGGGFGVTVAMLALAVTACGGGSSGGGSPSSPSSPSLTEKEQAALVAMAGSGAVAGATASADSAAYDEEDENTGGTSPLVQAASTPSSLAKSCDGSGAIHMWTSDNSDSYPDADFIQDVNALNEALANGNSVMDDSSGGIPTGGSWERWQQRTDCVLSSVGGLEYEGAADFVEYTGFDSKANNRASYFLMGGLGGDVDDNSVAPDSDAPFGGANQYASSSVRAIGRFCEGCPHGDLSAFDGDIRSSAFVGFMELNLHLPDGQGGSFEIDYTVGDGPQQPLSMTTAWNQNEDATEVILDGRLTVENAANSQCSFDVTYDMDDTRHLLVEDFELEGQGDLKNGSEMTVVFNDSGRSYDVKVELGKTLVRETGSGPDGWEEIDVSGEADSCGITDEETGSGDASELAGNTWQSSCVQTGGSEWQRQTFVFSDTAVTFSAELHDNNSCTNEIDNALSAFNYETRESGTEDEFEIDFTLTANSDGDTPGTVTYDLFTIVGGDTLYFGTEGGNPPTSEGSRPTSVDTTSEWAFSKQ